MAAPAPPERLPDGTKALGVRSEVLMHASCVAVAGRAVLIRGASGSGKSGLALQLMALGAGLVADDRTLLWRVDDTVLADAPPTLEGRIEARQFGILRAPAAGSSAVVLVVDMDTSETERLPPLRRTALLGLEIPIARKSELPHFPAAIMTYLYGERDA